MEAITDKFQQLSQRISQDRSLYVSNDTLLGALVVGEGFIAGKTDLEDEDKADDDDEEEAQEESLFMEELPKGDSAYIDRLGLPDEEDDLVEEEVDDRFAENIQWLNSLKPHIESFHSAPPSSCACLAIPAREHQLAALGKIEYNTRSPLKTTMNADTMGLGKTLVAVMAVVNAVPSAKRFSIIVATSSCLKQWEAEIGKFLEKDSVRLFVLRDPNTSPAELLKHDVILVSYHFVMSQYRRMCKYLKSVASLKQGVVTSLKRPNLSIFSDIFYTQAEKSPFLVLDEVTAVKNSSSTTFQAIEELRSLADGCIMLTGSPVDNTWFDLYAYVQLIPGHDIRSKVAMRALFARKTENRWGPPIGNQMRRLLQLLNSFVVRRPESIIPLPPLHVRTVRFELTPEEYTKSDEHAQIYMIICNANSDRVRGDQFSPWGRLTLASQHAYHPALEKIMHLVKNPNHDIDEDLAAADVLSEAKEIEEWVLWREEIERNENWRSSRIETIIDIFNQFRDKDPDCSVIIFDDSIFFLDIIEVAFSQMFEPEECLRYDGRLIAEKRSAVLEAFAAAGGPRVLLASRGAGGIGLNITTANKVILCGPWWKIELEDQAIKRSHRPGQEREVEAVKVLANCAIEEYKARLRDSKHKHNSKIVKNLTRPDGVVPKAWDDLE